MKKFVALLIALSPVFAFAGSASGECVGTLRYGLKNESLIAACGEVKNGFALACVRDLSFYTQSEETIRACGKISNGTGLACMRDLSFSQQTEANILSCAQY